MRLRENKERGMVDKAGMNLAPIMEIRGLWPV